MKKLLWTVVVALLALIWLGCPNPLRRVFNNPVDPESDTYIGTPSEDNDGDGIPQYEDVDEIVLLSPKDGETITILPLSLLTYKFNPAKVKEYWIQIATSNNDFGGSTIFSNDDYTSNECGIPLGVLPHNSTYYWRAKAYGSNKWSRNWSEIRSFVLDVDTSVPWYPSPASGSTINDTTPLLNWEDVTGATGYHIQLNTNDSFTGAMVSDDDALPSSQHQVATILSQHTQYFWRVKVKNMHGVWGDWSSPWNFTIDIASPVNPSPTSASIVPDTTPLLDWDDVSGAGGYHVQVNTTSSFTGTMVCEDSFLSTSLYQVSSTLSYYTTYYWRVKVKNIDGVWGDWSNTWSFTVSQKLVAIDWEEGDLFAKSVVISGDRAIVGAYGDDDRGSGSGSAYIFQWDGSNWVEAQKITASDGAADDWFGRSLAISGDRAIVGAYGDDDRGSGSGSAYLFHWDGSNWVEAQKITASDGAVADSFGSSVAISGDRAIVGAYGDDDKGEGSGSAYLFHWDGSDWVEVEKITASDGAFEDHFGWSVAISGDIAIVGAENKNDMSGSAYLFHWDGSNWVEAQKITASDGAAHDAFGQSVAISGDKAIVGAYGDDDRGSGSGSAYIFQWDGSNWVEAQKITTSDGAADDWFGYSVAISGDRAIVGAHEDDDRGLGSGSAYLFHWDGSNWAEVQKIIASDGHASNRFGYSVSISGNRAIIGTPYDYPGSAYIY